MRTETSVPTRATSASQSAPQQTVLHARTLPECIGACGQGASVHRSTGEVTQWQSCAITATRQVSSQSHYRNGNGRDARILLKLTKPFLCRWAGWLF